MFTHVLAFTLLLAPAAITDQPVKATPGSAKLSTIVVDGMTFTARTIQFRSEDGSTHCTLEGDAKVTIGNDITITADKIQSSGNLELKSLTCTGNCSWKQEDGSGEVFSGDKLEFQQDGLRLIGNASLRYGSNDNITVITCESISVRTGNQGYDFSGAVQLRRGN